jgi:hypothetical protein
MNVFIVLRRVDCPGHVKGYVEELCSMTGCATEHSTALAVEAAEQARGLSERHQGTYSVLELDPDDGDRYLAVYTNGKAA